MLSKEIIDDEKKYILQVFPRPPFVLERGNGINLFDMEGNRYLDFTSGLSVNAFGYGAFDIIETVKHQAAQLIHCSNLFYSIPQVQLARLLVENSFADKVFLCNSGAEAIEAAIKFARRWGNMDQGAMSDPSPSGAAVDKGEREPPTTRYEIITMRNSFHGRTYGALSATGQPKLQRDFGPMLPGFITAEFNNLDSVRKAIGSETCAVLVEPLQGEGGVIPASREFLHGLRCLCDENNLLLIFDEVQFGLVRSGSVFAYQHFDVEPDIMTLAKPLGGGLPIGAVLMRERVAQYLGPGDHGTTFGGGPLVCAVAIKVMQKLLNPELLQQVRARGEYLHRRLNQLKQRHPQIKEVRGFGLIAGVVTDYPAKAVAEEFRKRGVLVCTSGERVVRLLPPLIVQESHIDEVVDIFDEILRQGVEQ
ncbi:MAG TPA: aspartate aminotransferase family protein [Candidatus Latescibacteria bacterium]|nr:aspartate aminotransferase family protein [Candidatus Latescibacterota bacterium]